MKGMWLGFRDSVWLIHVSQLNQAAEGKKKGKKQKQSELTDEEPSPGLIPSSVWTRGSAVVSSCAAMAERVRMESSKRNGWPGGGQRGEECVARVLRLRSSALNSRSLASGDEPERRHRRRRPSDPWVSGAAPRGVHTRIRGDTRRNITGDGREGEKSGGIRSK